MQISSLCAFISVMWSLLDLFDVLHLISQTVYISLPHVIRVVGIEGQVCLHTFHHVLKNIILHLVVLIFLPFLTFSASL